MVYITLFGLGKPKFTARRKTIVRKKNEIYFVQSSLKSHPLWITLGNCAWFCSQTLNIKYIERIYEMSSLQFFNEFYTILRESKYLQKEINSHEYSGTV